MIGGRRWLTLALVAFIALIINFPAAHATYQQWQIGRDGVDVVASVTETQVVGEEYLVQFTVPAGPGRDEFEGAVAQVDKPTYELARDTGSIAVRVLPDNGGAFEADGQITSRIGIVVTLLADLFLLAVVVLMLRFRKALRVELVLRATEDLKRCAPGGRLDRIEGQRYLVAGDIVELDRDADELVLDLGDRRVRVLLDGHANPAGYEQPVQVVGYMVA